MPTISTGNPMSDAMAVLMTAKELAEKARDKPEYVTALVDMTAVLLGQEGDTELLREMIANSHP